MLRIIEGAFNSSRDRAFCDAVAEAEKLGREVLVIMPDQYSFECDRKLYKALGAAAFNRISAAGFNRLAELISRRYGKSAFENAADDIRLIVMYKAVTRFKAERDVRFYGRSLEKSRFIGEMLSLVAELIRSAISPESLRAASERLEGSISLKLYDISRIFSFYLEELEKAGLRDSLTALADAGRIAAAEGFFSGMAVFIDGFTDFTKDEYDMIGTMLSQGADVTVSLLYHRTPREDHIDSPFAVTVRTRSGLRALAEAHGCGFSEQQLEDISGACEKILAVDRYFCTGELPLPPAKKTDTAKYKSSLDRAAAFRNEGLALVCANDIYDEIEYVCAEIERLVREEGYSYSEIAVAARDIASLAQTAEGTFGRYEIPCFIDHSSRADDSVIVIFLKSLFACVTGGHYRTDEIMRYVRSPLSCFNDIEVTLLEEHIITYGIDGDMWLEPFGSHDRRHEVPKVIEELRQRIILPFERFRKAAQDASAAGIAEALFSLVKEIDLPGQVYSVFARRPEEDAASKLELERANRRLWQSVLGAVKTIHDEMGEEKLSIRRFGELFGLMTSQMSISAPPQRLQAVRFVSAESSRLDDVKVLFVLEVNERVFPAEPGTGGLFTEREKQLLQKADLPLSDTALNSTLAERLVVYRTLCLPKEKLYVMYSETDGSGKLRQPSLLIDKLYEIFGEVDKLRVSDLPVSFFCTSYRTGYYKFLEHSKDRLVVSDSTGVMNRDRSDSLRDRIAAADHAASLEQALRNDEACASRLDALPGYAGSLDYSISRETAKKLFYPEKLVLSATSIDNFYTCPFMYFCKYGLALRDPQSLKFDSASRGNYVHRSLEAVMTKEQDGRRVYDDSFTTLSERQIRARIDKAFDDFDETENGGSYGKRAAFLAQREKYKDSVYNIVRLVQEEFLGSLFKPTYFEYRLVRDDKSSLLTMKLSDELTVTLTGSIDRVDVFKDIDGREYVRIVDYKSGSTTLDLAAVYHGLNLQMFVYLLAMTESSELLPAAAVYSHISEPEAKLLPPEYGEEPDTRSQRIKQFKPDGMMLDRASVIKAFNTAGNDSFLPVILKNDGTVSKKGAPAYSAEFIAACEEFARRKMTSLAEKVAAGTVPAEPLMKRTYDPCTKCEHYAVCGRVRRGEPAQIRKEDKQGFMDEISGIIAEGKEDGSDEME
ncbi:MAG: PD-(D/E)XK nuclease family protein [Ruminococcus sp.]|nr:PD-(D/E)XK nuclease family protein [Ruminococcus sp.]